MPIEVRDGDAAKIKTEAIFFELNDAKSAQMLVESFDYVPYVYLKKINDTMNTPPIDGTSIDSTDIIYIKLFNSKFLPEVELYCNDPKGILFNDLYPFDHDTLLCVFIKSNSELTLPIRMDFMITEYETIKSDTNKEIVKYLIKGILNVEDLYYTRYEIFNDTSYNVIKQIVKDMGLGWASNITSTDDKMKWINPSNTYLEFIKEITKYSWIDEDSFIWTFIDFYYNLNYVNVQLELNEFNKNEQGTITNIKIEKNQEEKNVALYLTNSKAFHMTNKYIARFDLINQSFKTNLETFYQITSSFYDKNENTVFKKYIKKLENDTSKLGDNEGSLVQLYDKDSTIFKENVNDEYFIGKIDTQDNVHKNYSIAKTSNLYNISSMQKMTMIVTLTQVNFSIKRFQNVKIDIYNRQDLLSRVADKLKPVDNINQRLSGYWYVTGINYLYKKSGGIEQEITLMRRDLSKEYGLDSAAKDDLRK